MKGKMKNPDGVAKRGKTKCRMVGMAMGGKVNKMAMGGNVKKMRYGGNVKMRSGGKCG